MLGRQPCQPWTKTRCKCQQARQRRWAQAVSTCAALRWKACLGGNLSACEGTRLRLQALMGGSGCCSSYQTRRSKHGCPWWGRREGQAARQRLKLCAERGTRRVRLRQRGRRAEPDRRCRAWCGCRWRCRSRGWRGGCHRLPSAYPGRVHEHAECAQVVGVRGPRVRPHAHQGRMEKGAHHKEAEAGMGELGVSYNENGCCVHQACIRAWGLCNTPLFTVPCKIKQLDVRLHNGTFLVARQGPASLR